MKFLGRAEKEMQTGYPGCQFPYLQNARLAYLHSGDLAKFSGTLNQGQRRALGIRRNPQGKYPAPSQSAFSRFFGAIDPRPLQETLLEIQALVRGPKRTHSIAGFARSLGQPGRAAYSG